MEENNQLNSNIQDDVTQAKPPGEKVIQPSAALIAEMKAAQTATPSPSQVTNNYWATVPLPTSNPIKTSLTPPSSVYPEVTRGIGAEAASSAPIPQDEPLPGPNLTSNTTPKVIAIKFVAGVLILINLINVFNWAISSHQNVYSWINVLGIAVSFLLAIGIFSLKETARTIYVFLSIIMLVLACIGVVVSLALAHDISNQFNHVGLTRPQIEKEISIVENNKALSAQTKQQDVQRLQNEINGLPKNSFTAIDVRVYISTGLSIITSLGPLIFFTRPSIKSAFNYAEGS
jgi:hypothetical protein